MRQHILSVLVVDDELPIRQELSTFNWEMHNSVLVGEAANGKEALEFCREYVPDVIITDITMPVMDGLELFRKLKAEFPNIKVIILTCYSEFTYAKEALQLGAIDYILKVTISPEAIGKALQSARGALEKDMLIEKTEKEFTRIELSKNILSFFTDESVQPKDLVKKINSSETLITLPCRQILITVSCNNKDWIFINSEITAVFDNEKWIRNWVLLEAGIYVLFIKHSTINKNELQENTQKLVAILEKQVCQKLPFISGDVQLYGVVCSVCSTADEYAHEFKKIILWKNLGFYYNNQKIFDCDEYKSNQVKKINLDLSEILDQINESGKSVLEFIRSDLREMAAASLMDSEEFKNLVIQLIGSQIDKKMRHKVTQKIWKANNLDSILNVITFELQNERYKENKLRLEIKKAIEIITNRFAEPISLSSVAEEVNLSSQYLSRIFGEEVGETFNEYVTKVRMENAKRLIKETNMKVYEVAEKVGIPNYRYFSTIYREYTGMSPKDYKRGLTDE